MKKEIKLIIAFIAFSAYAIFGQSTTKSYTSTLKFFTSDLLQEYQALRLAAPTMTLPNSLTTYTSTLPFNSSDARQIYNAMRGVGDAISSYTSSAWRLNGNAISTNTNFIGTTTNRSLLFYTNNLRGAKLDSLGRFGINISQPTATLHVIGTMSVSSTSTLVGNVVCSADINAATGNIAIFRSNNISPTGVNNDLTLTLRPSHSSRNIILSTNGATPSETMRLDGNGRVGINVASPTATLQVGGTMSVSSTASLNGLQLASGSMSVTSKTIDAVAGDAATINSPVGRFEKDNTGTTFTLTNSFITPNSIILLTPSSDMGTGTKYEMYVVAGNGSAVINFEQAPDQCSINFLVIN